MKTRLILLFHIYFFLLCIVYGQINESWKVYDDSNVALIKITVSPEDLQYMYDNPRSDSMHLSSVYFKNAYIDEYIDSVGFRLRGNTSRDAYKKSFKLSFNTFIKGGDFYSLEKINLNGEHNDPSIVRSKLCWDFFNSIGIVSSRAAHAAVFINDKYYGLYISVEHVDEEFIKKNYEDDSGNLWKCLFGADLVYLGSNPDLYKFVNESGIRPYRLITNESTDDYLPLSRLINIINNSPNETFEDSLESILDVTGVLKYLATNVLVGGWDDYWSLSNNYYLYYNPTKDKFSLIPYDYDNTFGVTWWKEINWETVNPYTFGQIVPGPRPLVDRIMSIPKYRNLYSHFLEYFSNIFNNDHFYNALVDFRTQIQGYAELDTFRLKDWGFTNQDFLNSFNGSSYYYENVIIIPNSIKDFVVNRTNSLNSQINFLDNPPIIYNVNLSSKKLQPDDSLRISASVFSSKGLKSVKFEQVINESPAEYIELIYTPSLNTFSIEQSDLWSITVPPYGNSKNVTIKIIAEDNSGGITVYPQNGIAIKTGSEVTNEIIINELMSVNTNTITDQVSEYEDWVELYNPQDTSIILSGKYLTDKKNNLVKWKFPDGMTIAPGEYKIFWCDEDKLQGEDHTNFKLSSNGEYLAIIDVDGISIIDSVTFPSLIENTSYARINDKSDWIVTYTATPGQSNIITNIDDDSSVKKSYSLNAYPNPFNPSTVIEYEIAKPMNIELNIFDVLGRKVWTNNIGNVKSGKYSIRWNGLNNFGEEISSGIYLLYINGDSYKKAIKLMLLR